MAALHKRAVFRLMVGGSIIASSGPGEAPDGRRATPAPVDQTQQTEEQRPTTANTTTADAPPGVAGNDIVITGIRASLRQSMDIKKNSHGVVDAISAEEMGKFPDTNLAESLQRITGVSIDRSNGEGSFVTVRGFGPEYNLVLLNGRAMPTSIARRRRQRAAFARIRFRQPRVGRHRRGRSLQIGPGNAADRRHRLDHQHPDAAPARPSGHARKPFRKGRPRHVAERPQ